MYIISFTCISNFIRTHPANMLPNTRPNESDVNCSGTVET